MSEAKKFMHRSLHPLFRRFLSNSEGRIVMWQKPNPPLVAWLVFTVLGLLLHAGTLRSIVHLAAHIAILIWAALELFWGASPFRRTLGAIVMLLTVLSVLR
jgi:hypothetical protein